MIWLRKYCLILLLLFLVPCVVSSSPKDTIVEQLTAYQNDLLRVRNSMINYAQQVELLQSRIAIAESLLKSSEERINSLSQMLAELELSSETSKELLAGLEQDLEKERILYMQSLQALNSLKMQYDFFRKSTYVLASTTVVLAIALLFSFTSP